MMRFRAFVAFLMLAAAGGQALAQNASEAERETDLLLERALQSWSGDFDAMLERGFIRIGVPHNPLFFAFDGEKKAGLAAERGQALEAYLRKKHKKLVTVIFLPKARDVLLPSLINGGVDMLDANLTITPQRQQEVDFSLPIRTDVKELVVTNSKAGNLASFDDLEGLTVHVRQSSSYFAHLEALNQARTAAGKTPIRVEAANELLEDNDLLEMVHAGSIGATVVDSHKAELWAQVYSGLQIHEELPLSENGETAFALRQNSPLLKAELDAFSKTVKIKSQMGNILHRRYLESAAWVKKVEGSIITGERQHAVDLVKEYSDRFGFDWILVAAQAYQESGFDQSKRSGAGAIGIMQVMPATAQDPNVAIPEITEAEPNVHAGVKYLRFLRDRYFDDAAVGGFDKVMLSLAAYNAGPGNIRKARARAEKMGLDPNIWFGNVEIATARAVSGEPVIYVRNIVKYAVDLRLTAALEEEKAALEAAAGKE